MKEKTLTGLLIVLGLGLGLVLMAGDRSVSRIMEQCGEFISNGLGL